MKKKIGYLLFACFFYLARITGVRKKKVFCVMTHDDSEDSGVGVVVAALREKGGYHFHRVTKGQREAASRNVLSQFFSFFVCNAFALATSEYVLLDNEFLPMAYLHFSKKTKVIQLWHGTGTIKKFGQSVNTGELGRLEYKANRCITHLIVNSEYTKKQYKEAFGIPEERIFVWGLPRTDLMFSGEKKEQCLQKFYQEYPSLQGQKLVLYAPTFRDDEVEHPSMPLDASLIDKMLPVGYTLLYRFHPHVAKTYEEVLQTSESSRMVSMSLYPDLNTLLWAADILVTDYSSIIFEYSVRKQPMIFYAYDLEKFGQSGRGFYEPYEEYVPGKVVHTTKELLEEIKRLTNEPATYQKACKVTEEFLNQSFAFQDGESSRRLFERAFEN